ncbi:MAG TPA: glycosyltransferase family 9 protein [Chitinophagaceae bacterium]
MAKPRHLLVFRFSAMGDVAMTIPVIRLLLQQYPDLRITFVSNGFFQPMFANIERLNFYNADLKGTHKGFKGLYRLYKELKQRFDFDAVADLHNVLRTQVIRKFFLFSSKPFVAIDKGRNEKKALTRKDNKVLKQLPATFDRYAEVFKKLGLSIQLNAALSPLPVTITQNSFVQLKQQGYKLIGIAPFAQHKEKMYPVEKMKEVVRMLLANKNSKLFLFGGGKAEIELLQQWEKELTGVENMAGKMNFEKELEHISQLDLMLSMDSANMHLASLYNVPVVSVWGATHPFAGFYGWQQPANNAVQIDLYCRPCSVFGNKTCYRGDWACMNDLPPTLIHQRIMEVLTK